MMNSSDGTATVPFRDSYGNFIPRGGARFLSVTRERCTWALECSSSRNASESYETSEKNRYPEFILLSGIYRASR